MKRESLFEFELIGGDHQMGPDEDGKYITYKKGDTITTHEDLSKRFRGKFRKVSEEYLWNLEDYIVPENLLPPPTKSEIRCIGDKRLSILICTLKKRKRLLDRLLKVLEPQMVNSVEILIEEDEGKMSVGEKRNVLLKKAQGDYIAFIDDDDLVSINYVAKILWAVQTNPDCCSLKGLLIREKDYFEFFHSLEHRKWYRKGDRFFRCPNHLNTVKRKLVLQVGFPNLYKEEDKDYSNRLRPLLKTQEKIKGILYYYLKVKTWAKVK